LAEVGISLDTNVLPSQWRWWTFPIWNRQLKVCVKTSLMLFFWLTFLKRSAL